MDYIFYLKNGYTLNVTSNNILETLIEMFGQDAKIIDVKEEVIKINRRK